MRKEGLGRSDETKQPNHTDASFTLGSLSPGTTARDHSSRREPEAIPWTRFSERISYSTCNEDSKSELEALRLGPGKRVFCITAGGGRVLNLLYDRPREIVAVDVNPTQNHLLELKAAAMRTLGYQPYLAFLGVRPAHPLLRTEFSGMSAHAAAKE